MTSPSISASGGGRSKTLTLRVPGPELDSAEAARWEKQVLAALDGSPCGTCVIDLDGCTFIDSAGIGLLVRLYRLAQTRNVQIRLGNARGHVLRVLRMTRLDELFHLPAALESTERTLC
jgi:anti-anti-sigma factor